MRRGLASHRGDKTPAISASICIHSDRKEWMSHRSSPNFNSLLATPKQQQEVRMKALKTLTLRSALAVAMAALCFGTTAAAAQEIKARFGTSLPDSHPQTLGARKFAELVEQKSKGRIKISVYSGAQLGSDQQMQAALRGGIRSSRRRRRPRWPIWSRNSASLACPSRSPTRNRRTPFSTGRSAKASWPSWRKRTSSDWPTGKTASATSPTASARSSRRKISAV